MSTAERFLLRHKIGFYMEAIKANNSMVVAYDHSDLRLQDMRIGGSKSECDELWMCKVSKYINN